jgi:phytoene dehydrogenase-like protein
MGWISASRAIFVGTFEGAIAAETAAVSGRLSDPINLYVGIPTGATTAEASETPEEMAARLHATHGCLWHVDLSIWRMGPLRPARGLSGYRTPIAGYHLGGAGSHPMPGMSSLPGRLASAEILGEWRSGTTVSRAAGSRVLAR